jgi:fibronectin type 3 domain-containing protein
MTQIDLRWRDNSTSELGFNIIRKKGPRGRWTLIAKTSANVTRYSDTGLEPGTKYYYRVQAFNAEGTSPYSNLVNATTRSATLNAPTSLEARSVSATQIDLTWKDNSDNESGFEVFRRGGGSGTFVLIRTVSAGTTSFSDTGLTPSTTYEYQIRAVNEFAVSSTSTIVSATTREATFMVAPSGLGASRRDDGSVALSWQDNSNNETGFSIERRVAPDGPFDEIGTVSANVTSFIDSDADPSVDYAYRVRAFNASGFSEYSNSAAPPEDRALDAPTRFEALAISDSRIVLSWRDNASIESGYIIERRIGGEGSEFQVIREVDADTTSFTDTGLVSNTTYGYRIRATDGEGSFSNYSAVASERTLPLNASVPNAPSAMKATAMSGTDVRLNWHDNSFDETNFSIERALSLDGPFAIIDTVPENTTRYIDRDLDPGETYYYRVRARDGSVRSAATAIVRVTLPKPVKVSITTIESEGTEEGSPVVFAVKRQGDSSADLRVFFDVSGSATPGEDFDDPGDSVTILAGKTSARINVQPNDDSADESDESVVLTLRPDSAYKISPSLTSASGQIEDDDDDIAPASLASNGTARSVFAGNPIDDLLDVADFV